jgi:hypothetical protein
LLDVNPLVDAFALVRQISLGESSCSLTSTAAMMTTSDPLVNVFYRAYALSRTLADRYGGTASAEAAACRAEHTQTRSLLGHMLFTSSSSVVHTPASSPPPPSKPPTTATSTTLNIYKEASVSQVLVLKKRLDELMARLDELLAEWTDNPILLDIVKVGLTEFVLYVHRMLPCIHLVGVKCL